MQNQAQELFKVCTNGNLPYNKFKKYGFKEIEGPQDIIEGEVETERYNMIIENDNIDGKGPGYRSYTALSYVSSGTTNGNNSITMGKGTDKQVTKQARKSNDRVKYKVAMEYVDEEELIWTDYLSISKRYDKMDLRMRAIGRAYALSSRTIVILDARDATLMLGIKGLSNQLDEILITEGLVNSNNVFDNAINNENATKVLETIKKDAVELMSIMNSRGEFSYWSRAWTMQEQHLSNTLLYGYIGRSEEGSIRRFVPIIESEQLIHLFKKLHTLSCTIILNDTSKYTDNDEYPLPMVAGSITNLIKDMLSGHEIAELSKALIGEKAMSGDDVLLHNLRSNVRCAVDDEEMTQAIAIALSIYDDSHNGRKAMIRRKFIENGYVTTKLGCVDNEDNKGWLPNKTKIGILGNKLANQFYSFEYLQFVKIDSNTGARIIYNDGGSIVIKGMLVKLKMEIESFINWNNNIIGNIFLCLSSDKEMLQARVTLCINDENVKIGATIVIAKEFVKEEHMYIMLLGSVSAIVHHQGKTIIGQIMFETAGYDLFWRKIVKNSEVRYIVVPDKVLTWDVILQETPTDIELKFDVEDIV